MRLARNCSDGILNRTRASVTPNLFLVNEMRTMASYSESVAVDLLGPVKLLCQGTLNLR